jgi:hypothetical protein
MVFRASIILRRIGVEISIFVFLLVHPGTMVEKQGLLLVGLLSLLTRMTWTVVWRYIKMVIRDWEPGWTLSVILISTLEPAGLLGVRRVESRP